MKRNYHHSNTEALSAPKAATPAKRVKLKRHRPITKKEIKAGLELLKMMGINPDEMPEERVREIASIWE